MHEGRAAVQLVERSGQWGPHAIGAGAKGNPVLGRQRVSSCHGIKPGATWSDP